MIVTTALLALVACGASDISTGDSGDTNGATDSGSTGGTNEQSPSIASVGALCTLQSTGDEYYLWTLEARVDDPQGLDTIELNNTVEVYRSDTLQASYGLLCSDRSDPPCIGSFRETDNGILCSSASDYTFKFLITDEDGNAAAKETTGSQG